MIFGFVCCVHVQSVKYSHVYDSERSELPAKIRMDGRQKMKTQKISDASTR